MSVDKEGKCQVEGCTKPLHTKIYCGLHATRFRRYGDPLILKRIYRLTSYVCKVTSCTDRAIAKELCQHHYNNKRSSGDPLVSKLRIRGRCSLENCLNPHWAKNLCEYHYKLKYYQDNRAISLHRSKIEGYKLKEKMFHLLNQHICIKCGQFDKRCLQIDHKNGGGTKQRLTMGVKTMWRYYLKHPEEAREKLQVLCANCNWIKRFDSNELKRD